MESKRQLQVAELIKRHVGLILQQEGIYIYGAKPLVTVTSVKMSPDFSIAKIYFSVYNIEDKQTPILELEDNYARLRQMLGKAIGQHTRRIPELQFYLDDTLDEMYRLNALFDSLEDDKKTEYSE
jgi:ribosome-binding factor A